MTQTIARIYGSRQQADAVVRTLQVRGYDTAAIHVVSGAAEHVASDLPSESGHDAAHEAVLKAGVAPEQAGACAERIRQGETLVAVAAPFGFALTTISVMQRHGRADEVAVVETPVEQLPRYAAAPLSAAMGWPVLSSDPTPLSSWLNWPTLKPEKAHSATLDKIREQSSDAAPLSRKIGMQVLSDKATPLSSKAGWRVLSDKPAPLSDRLGWRTLSDKPAPLSDKAGWKTLSDEAAPLSRKLGMKVLSDNPTPLSSLCGWKVLSTD